nr:hypothetical protein [Tanacetum cinerariifolium]
MNVDADITFIRSSSFDQEMKEANFDIESMPDDEIMYVLGKEDDDDDFEELSIADEIVADNVIDKTVSIESARDAYTLVFVASSLQVSIMSASISSLVALQGDAQALMLKLYGIKGTFPGLRFQAKRVKMMDEYNHCINFRDDPLPITKFNYKVNNDLKEATMRITRNSQPLNLKIYDKFILKMLGISKWLELHALTSNRLNATNDQLLKNLKAKFQWVATTTERLGIPPLPQLTAFEITPTEKKRKKKAKPVYIVDLTLNVLLDRFVDNVSDGFSQLLFKNNKLLTFQFIHRIKLLV